MAVDIVTQALAAASSRVQLNPMPCSRCMQLTRIGRLTGCFDTVRDRSLETEYLFHRQSLFQANANIYTRVHAKQISRQSKLTTQDLEGRRGGVTNGYTYGDEFDFNTNINKDISTHDVDSLHKLMLGRVDYVVMFEKVATYLARRYPDTFGDMIRQVGLIRPMSLYVSFSKRHPLAPSYMAALDRGLVIIRQNGEYAVIEAR